MSDLLQVAPIVDTTTNVLNDFDIAVSLTLKSMNTQLADAWKKWHSKTNGVNELTMTREEEDPGGDSDRDVYWNAQLKLGTPVVSVDPGKPGLHEVIVAFQIQSGTMEKKVDDRLARLDMSGRRFWITASLKQNVVSQEELYQVDPQTAKTVAALSGPAGAGLFTIECLFLNLTKVDVVTGFKLEVLEDAEAERRFTYEGFTEKWVAKASNLKTLRTSLENEFVLFMRNHFENEGNRNATKFLLNTTLRPHAPKAEPSLLVNGMSFKVTRSPDGQANSFLDSLDYLGTVVKGKALPAGGDLDKALATLGSWLTLSRVDGTQAMAAGVMALRGGCIAALMVDIFQRALPEQYKRMEAANNETVTRMKTVSNPGKELPYPEFKLLSTEPVTCDASGQIAIRSRDSSNEYKWRSVEDKNDVDFVLKKKLTVNLIPIRHKCYEITGLYRIDLKRKRHTTWGNTDAEATTEAKISGTLVLQANSDGVVCEITPEVAITIESGTQRSSHSGSNFLVDVFNKADWDGSQALGFSNDISAAIKKMLEEVFGQLNLRLKDFAIIPPGGEAFGFSRPRIGNNGDLLMDLVYRSSLKPK